MPRLAQGFAARGRERRCCDAGASRVCLARWSPRHAPVLMQPFVVSPSWWMWKPCRPGARPVSEPVTTVPRAHQPRDCAAGHNSTPQPAVARMGVVQQGRLLRALRALCEPHGTRHARAAGEHDHSLRHGAVVVVSGEGGARDDWFRSFGDVEPPTMQVCNALSRCRAPQPPRATAASQASLWRASSASTWGPG